MMRLFFGNALWQLIMQSDFVSWIVLLTLLGMSIVCWTVFIYKLIVLRLKTKHARDLLQVLPGVRSLPELHTIHAQHAETAPGNFLIKNLKATEWFIEINAGRAQAGMSQDQADAHEAQSYQIVDDMIAQEEAYLPVLSTSAAVSPLLGLFGTVWGLIQAFIAIGEKQAADIAAVAPGIAQALTTTLAGLLVAIPAFVMFNYLAWRIRAYEQLLVKIAERSNLLIRRFLVQ